jgi:hypothetical protein
MQILTTCGLVALCLQACSSMPVSITADPSATPSLSLAEFPGAASTFDARSDDPVWDGDDQVLFALRLCKGREIHRWLLRLEVVLGESLIARVEGSAEQKIELWENKTWTYTTNTQGEPQQHRVASRMLPVKVTVSDANGQQLARSLVKLPAHLLGRGLLSAIESARANASAGNAAGSDIQPVVEAIIATMSLLSVVQEDNVLADYFWQVVEKPGIWSVVTGLGVQATMSMPFEQSLPATRLPAGLPHVDPAYVVPLRIDVNGRAALLADVVVIDASRPYALCGGMVAAVARHPSKPDISFELQLVAARLGKEPTQATIHLDTK